MHSLAPPAGHADVVLPGPGAAWSAAVRDGTVTGDYVGLLWGRLAVGNALGPARRRDRIGVWPDATDAVWLDKWLE